MAEGVALPHVLRGVVEGGLADADGLGADGRPAAIQCGHGDAEPVALAADPVSHGYAHTVEDDFAGRAALDAHLPLELGHVHAPVALHHEGADAAMTRRRIG